MRYTTIATAIMLIFLQPTRAADAPVQPDDQNMQSWWEDLEKPEPACSRALLKLADHPAQMVAFFKEHLKPLAISEEDVKALLADLNSDDENVWKPAYEKLQYFDPRLAIDLSTLMADNLHAVGRSRMVEILCGWPVDSLRGRWMKLLPLGPGQTGYNFSDGTGAWWAEHRVERLTSGGTNSKPKWTRACRAIVLLEHVASPEALAILHDMAGGHPDAEPTKTAVEALAKIEAGTK